MPIDALLAGLDAACDRFQAVIHSQDRKVMYQPLFEALNWTVALDDRLQAEWKKAGAPLSEPWSQWFHRRSDSGGRPRLTPGRASAFTRKE